MTSEKRKYIEERCDIIRRATDELLASEIYTNVDNSFTGHHRVIRITVMIPLTNGVIPERRQSSRRPTGKDES